MNKVYVLTNESVHCLIGVFSTHKAATAAMLNAFSSWHIDNVELGTVCDTYKFVSPDECEVVECVIEMATVDDPMFLP